MPTGIKVRSWEQSKSDSVSLVEEVVITSSHMDKSMELMISMQVQYIRSSLTARSNLGKSRFLVERLEGGCG